MKADLIKKLDEFFNHHKTQETVLVCSDGHLFMNTSTGLNLAKDHCSRNGLKMETVKKGSYKTAKK